MGRTSVLVRAGPVCVCLDQCARASGRQYSGAGPTISGRREPSKRERLEKAEPRATSRWARLKRLLGVGAGGPNKRPGGSSIVRT